MSKVKCKNVGCPLEFRFPMQMYRHLAKCTYPSPPSKLYEALDGKFKCKRCSKQFSHQASVIRHLTTCDDTKKNQSNSVLHIYM